MKSLNVGNEEIFHEVKALGDYNTTSAMKEDIQRDMDHLYVLLRSMYRQRYPATYKNEHKSSIKSC